MKKISVVLFGFLMIYVVYELSMPYFFDFDELTHYRIEVEPENVFGINDKDELPIIEQIKLDLVVYEKPESITDTLFIDQLEKMGFKKKPINEDKFDCINNLFREKIVFNGMSAACSPIYRDILIFRRQGKVIGVTKICFGCQQFSILGTQANTSNFGQGSDMYELQNLLTK